MVYNPRKTIPSVGLEEDEYGTQSTGLDQYWGIFQPVTRNDDYDLAERDGLRDSIESGGYDIMVKRHAFDMPLDWLSNWKWLFFVFGQQDESGPVSTVFTHELEPLNDSYHPSFTIEFAEKGTPNDVSRYLGTTINEATIEWSSSEQVKTTLGVIAQDMIEDTALVGSASEPAGVKFYKYSHVKLLIAGEVVKHENGSFNIQKNLDAEPRVTDATGNIKIARPYVGKMVYNLTFTRKKDDKTIKAAWLAGTPVAVELHFIKEDGSDEAKFDLGTCILKQNQTSLDTGNSTNNEDVTVQPTNVSVVVKDKEAWPEMEDAS